MQKTKLGISTNLLAAIIYLLSLSIFFGSNYFIVPMALAVSYVLYKETDSWLKSRAINATMITLLYIVIKVAWNTIYMQIIQFINFFLQFADTNITDRYQIDDFIFLLISWTFKAIIIVGVLMSLSGKGINLFKKHID